MQLISDILLLSTDGGFRFKLPQCICSAFLSCGNIYIPLLALLFLELQHRFTQAGTSIYRFTILTPISIVLQDFGQVATSWSGTLLRCFVRYGWQTNQGGRAWVPYRLAIYCDEQKFTATATVFITGAFLVGVMAIKPPLRRYLAILRVFGLLRWIYNHSISQGC